ncbi:hypothetical protein GCM10022291_28840 [Postechiella marina]|uniref:Uncharacterized protein n=1 Tax=Postechiella marina TaxID=943941 RepID=A0ABP8CEU0_9FLAO
MKTIHLLTLFLFTTLGFSQQSFFKAIEAHGEEAVYQRYYSVYKDDDGKQVIKGKQYQVKVELLKKQGIYSGVKLVPATKNDKSSYTIDATKSKSSKIIGYPNVSHLVDKISRKGLVVVGDYIFKVGNVWKENDGLVFNDINEIYIRVGATGTENDKSDRKKKKKFGAFMGKLKAAAMNKVPAECTSPACKKAESMDLNKYVLDYLETMKAKQDAYALTTKDKADIAIIENAVNGYYDHVNKTNDAYWKSAEGQAILENRRRAEGYAAKNEVTLKNNMGRTIYIATKGSRNPGTELSSGASTNWNCETDAYFQTKNTKDTNTNYYETTSRKAYTANSNCGGTKVIN